MANAFTQIYIQAIFAVQNRDCIIRSNWEDELQKYITGIIQNEGHKMLAINGTHNHVHLFFGMKPNHSVSKLIQDVKSNSSKWITEKRFIKSKFSWQEGFGAFSYGHSQLTDVISYVKNQKEHHKKQTFREEYLLFLKKFNIEYDEKYLFDFFN
jgi:putative transposase